MWLMDLNRSSEYPLSESESSDEDKVCGSHSGPLRGRRLTDRHLDPKGVKRGTKTIKRSRGVY